MTVGVWRSKHSTGITTRDIDFAPRLAEGETLSSPTAAATLVEGAASPALATSNVVVDGTKIRVRLSGGAANARWRVFLQAQTSGSLTVEDYAEIVIDDT